MYDMQETIRRANAAGRTAVIPFITAGFPEPESFWEKLAEIDACGVDIIEVGIPFSDPVADGPVIEECSRRALEAGVTLRRVLEGLRARRGQLRADIVLMGYTNPFLQYGLDRLGADAAEAGVRGLIVPDLPLEEAAPYREALQAHGLCLITLVAPNTSLERMRLYAQEARGYVYVVSLLGTTGSGAGAADIVAETLRRARRAFSLPLALGFGLCRPEQLTELPADARPDAAVIGTALLRHLQAGKPAAEFLGPWVEG